MTTTGHPAASADAVSPPAVEKASGKLDAPKTATGPIGTLHDLEVGARQRLAVGQGRVVTPVEVVTFEDVIGKEAQLAGRPPPFALEARFGKPGFLGADQGDVITSRASISSAMAFRKSARA